MRKPKALVSAVLLLLVVYPASAQWERLGGENKGSLLGPPALSTPHPLQFYLTPSLDRDPGNSLCLGCKAGGGKKVSLQDYEVKTSTQVVGEPFGKKILQIELSFHVIKGSMVEQLRREWEENEPRAGQNASFDDIPPVEWKSIVMESSADLYNELYFIIDDGTYVRPLSKPRLFTVGGTQILATNDPVDGNGGYCAEAYWVLQPDGPWMLDFTHVHQEIERLIPRDAKPVETGCWALSVEHGQLETPIQRKDAECRACGHLGTVVVRFRIDGHRAVPVSSSFEQEPTTP